MVPCSKNLLVRAFSATLNKQPRNQAALVYSEHPNKHKDKLVVVYSAHLNKPKVVGLGDNNLDNRNSNSKLNKADCSRADRQLYRQAKSEALTHKAVVGYLETQCKDSNRANSKVPWAKVFP